jgi:hypothetical protein
LETAPAACAREGDRPEERTVLETQGAISHKRAKIKVPIAATKRALATVGCFDLAGAEVG